jgi:hypothetical protein
MSKKVLLREYYELCEGGVCQDLLTEAEKQEVANGTLYLTGIMQCADKLNGNGRVYPHRVLEREMKNYTKIINERRALGELDHPEDSVVNLRNASHMVTSVWWDGKNVMGKVKVLNTPSGQILSSLVQSGVKLGISSRGLGSVHEDNNGATVVEDDFQLICFDFVSEPSTPEAYMSVNENMEKKLFTKADRINRILNSIIGDE